MYANLNLNLEAIKSLKSSAPDLSLLNQFKGWGSLKDSFAEGHKDYQELRELLTEEEYALAKGSVLNAHYTSNEVISALWAKLQDAGFSGGKVLEPSCGIGKFLSLCPQNIKESVEFTGVELDPIPAQIAGLLNPNSKIYNSPFEEVSFPDNYFDLVIGNVPFGAYKVHDPRYDALNLSIHNYFIAKSLDLVKEGGVICVITSPFTMDSKNTNFREWLSKRTELITVFRLPSEAFKASSNTEVSADVLILKKCISANGHYSWDDAIITEEYKYSQKNFFDLPSWGENFRAEITCNKYWINELTDRVSCDCFYPHRLLGLPTVNKLYGTGLSCSDNKGDYDFLEGIKNVPVPQIFSNEGVKKEEGRVILIPQELQSAKLNSFVILNNEVYIREQDELIKSSVNIHKVNAFKSLHTLTLDVINAQKHLVDNELSHVQLHLKNSYDNFKSEYGELNSARNIKELSQDPDFYLVRTLEKVKGKKVIGLADVFSKRVIKQFDNTTAPKTVEDAIILSLNKFGNYNYEFMSNSLNINKEELTTLMVDKGLIYFNPSIEVNDYEEKDKYLSGNVYAKLQDAIKYDLSNNVEALKKAQPLPMLPTTNEDIKFKCLLELGINWEELPTEIQNRVFSKKIDAKIGASWIPPHIYSQFCYEILHAQGMVSVSYIASPVATWYIDPKRSSDYYEFGTKHLSSYEILEKVLNNQDIKVAIYSDKEVDREASVVATEEARAKASLIKQEWKDWLWSCPERCVNLCKIYNTTVNIYTARKYDGSWLTLPGLNPSIKLRPWQLNAIARIIENRATYLAHDVGLGKSLVMICAIMELRRLGICHKPMLVCLNGTEQQLYNDFKDAYPLANVLISNGLSSKEDKKLFTASIKTGDFDCVILTHSQFFQLSLGKEYQVQFLQQERELLLNFINSDRELSNPKSVGGKILKKRLESVEMSIFDAENPELNNLVVADKDGKGKGKKLTRQQKEEIRKGKSIDALNLKILESKRKYDHVTFEGITDCLVIDEVHQFKNLAVITKLMNVRGIPTSHSQRATDTYTKILYTLDNLLNKAVKNSVGNGRVIGATGTIFSNTLAEIYNWQRMFQLPLLKELGIDAFDAWVSQFAEVVSSAEISPEGIYKIKTRLKKFSNLSVLHNTMSQFVDIVTFDMIGAKAGREHGLIRPEGKFIDIIAAPSNRQLEFLSGALKRAEAIQNGDVDPTEDNFLKLTTDLTKAALSMRLLGDKSEARESKLHDVAYNIHKIWEETKEFNGVQLAFCDFSTPKNTVKTSAKIRTLLINNGGNKEDVKELMKSGDIESLSYALPEELPLLTEELILKLKLSKFLIPQISSIIEAGKKISYNVYEYVKNLLLLLGIPENQIEFIHAHNGSKRAKLFDKVNNGEVRVLLGSTSKLGTGCNVHKGGLWALHHIDAPWRPSDIEQREGRGIRQLNGEYLGKTLGAVLVFRYITEKLDALRWQTLQWKQEATKSFLNGADLDSLEDVDDVCVTFAQVKSLATGNKLLIEETNLQNELNSLLIQERSHSQQQLGISGEISRASNKIKSILEKMDAVEIDIKSLAEIERLTRRISEEEEELQAKIQGGENDLSGLKALLEKATAAKDEKYVEIYSNAINESKLRIKELKTKVKEFLTEEDKAQELKLKQESNAISAQFSLLSKDAGIAHGTTRLAGSYRGLEIYATNFGSSLNYAIKSTYSENSYGFPFRVSQDRLITLNRTNPIQSIDRWVDELPHYLARLNNDLEGAKIELNRSESIKGKVFYGLGRLNEVQTQLMEIRELMTQDKNVLNVSSCGSDEDGQNSAEEYLEDDLSSTEVGVNLEIVEELKNLTFDDYCGDKNIPNYIEGFISPQLKELRIIELTRSLEVSCNENNLMRIALIYKSCRDYPQHWTAALKALSLENKKVCIKTLAKLKAVA
jgi:N12 class adenine-specific DNA methylase/SAM-dependent methyltransferase